MVFGWSTTRRSTYQYRPRQQIGLDIVEASGLETGLDENLPRGGDNLSLAWLRCISLCEPRGFSRILRPCAAGTKERSADLCKYRLNASGELGWR